MKEAQEGKEKFHHALGTISELEQLEVLHWVAGGLSLIPNLLDQIDGKEPDAEVGPGPYHHEEAWDEQAVADIDRQLEKRRKDI